MRKALVIDDEQDICLMLTRHLQNLHFHTRYVSTFKDARLLAVSSWDLMFVDLNLPDGSGFDVMNYVTRHKVRPKIIVISAYDSEADKAIQMGAHIFIKKPFTMKEVDRSLTALHFLPDLLLDLPVEKP